MARCEIPPMRSFTNSKHKTAKQKNTFDLVASEGVNNIVKTLILHCWSDLFPAEKVLYVLTPIPSLLRLPFIRISSITNFICLLNTHPHPLSTS
jgi:hypothetical protein